jgi:two-component system chemotaxis response regulator CheB
MSALPIKVLVVDDTAVTRMLLVHLLDSDPGIRVVGAVSDGQAAVEFVQAEKPDVVLMDIHMPRLDGFEATRRIMETQPVPIVICSATADPTEVATTFRLLEAGALACVAKPVSREHPDFEALTAHLLQTVRLMSEVKVVRRWARHRTLTVVQRADASRAAAGIRLIGIGTSTGAANDPVEPAQGLSGSPADRAAHRTRVSARPDRMARPDHRRARSPRCARCEPASGARLPRPG